MFRKSILLLVTAALIAAMLVVVSDRRGFQELTVRAAIAERTVAKDTKCPLSPKYTDSAGIGLLSICLRHGLVAYEAAQRYPAAAANVFAVYGEDETFQKVLDRYGHQVIPVIALFVEQGSREFQLRQALGEAMQHIWEGKKPKWKPSEITREQVGLIAIHQLEVRGNEMLAEFEIVDGTAKRKPMTRIILGVKDLLLGGVGDVETILVRGERLPNWKDVGFAALDVAIVASGVGAVAKAARIGVGAAETAEKSTIRIAAEGATEKNSIRLAAGEAAEKNALRVGEGAYEAISAVGRTGALIGPVAFAYVAITRPQLLASAGGWIAEQFGFSRSVGIFAVYLVGIFLIFQFLRPFLWCGRIVGKPIFRLARYTYNKAAA